ncbi:MAG: hypothetical protein AVDCRST_MAG25-1592, partial [uncultured Rubrobacteraceae bacterium]
WRRRAPSQAKAPRQTTTRADSRASSRAAKGRHLSRSPGVGLFWGGAQRTTAEIQRSRRVASPLRR